MFTRSELESKTLKELKDLAARYGVKPVGNAGYKTSWITPLSAFAVQAIRQFQDHKTHNCKS
ncbi:MAG: Rho termination factor N-terminal domain-containing protein [Nostoc sp. ChiSLP01]|nr:Rho termination factor N-terminal domain-containing protein [Nostoc sp. CmiSLP01]MDZ8286854.1 Rho termination factor N-terminal domain-containing protein [Nostoc sp. ChiSLP01]